jgi:hypothetical protein
MYIRMGSSRTGLKLGKFFIKIPFTFYKKVGIRGFWYRLLKGLQANILELEYKNIPYAFLDYGIVLNTPIYGSKLGFFNIYYFASSVKNIEIIPNRLPDIIEYKLSSFGYVKNKLVCIDYA